MEARTPPAIVKATPADWDRCMGALGTAFVSDPLIRWMFPDARQYLTYFVQVGKFFAGRAFEHDSAYRTEDFLGTALWLPPGVSPDEESLGELMATAVEPSLQEDVFGLLEQVGAGHPETPHWYLPAIGVDPTRQGQGYGSALLASSLQVVDSTHDMAYLESSNSLNVPLYERFGFQVVGTIQSGGSPTITRMLRSPR